MLAIAVEKQKELTIAQKTSAGSLVQADQTKVPNDPHGRSLWNALDVLCKLTLDLKTNLDDLKRICEDLSCVSAQRLL